ncbi:MAG: peptidylprolyl isomerase [Planctomycetota bacterium]
MNRILREPLFHFVLLGGLLFLLDSFRSPRTRAPGDDEIVVTEGRIASMTLLFTKTWQRPPTEVELRGLIDDFVREEALYRQGLAMGIDRDDVIIRRRVRQKMEFVVDDLVDLAEPTDADLQQWLDERADDYARPGRFRFRQVFLNPERRGEAAQAEAAALLERLRTEEDGPWVLEAGDPTLLEHAYAHASTRSVARDFGQDFLTALQAAPLEEWSGPVASAFGLHLVRVDDRTPGEPATLDEVRAEVERDWRHAQVEEATNRFYDELVAGYEITIEWPQELGIEEPAGE